MTVMAGQVHVRADTQKKWMEIEGEKHSLVIGRSF